MSTPSTLVADRYRLVALLGAGGMGVVWHAWDERLHRNVALKMLRTQPELTDAERQLATDRAMREARITAGLHHPHAVTVFDVVEHDGQPCIVMQLIESTPLSALLREHGTLTPVETSRIGAQVGSALAAAHKLRIVHRDVKPGNILITEDGSAMISDFGISHALGDATITATGMMHGTPAYLAPEVARGLPTSFASDVFSLGSTLYAMLEGEPPFGSDQNAIALLHKVAGGNYPYPEHAGPLAPLLEEMLSADPKKRPSMATIVQSLSAGTDENRPATGAVPVALDRPGDGNAPERTDRPDSEPTERNAPAPAPTPLPDAGEKPGPQPAPTGPGPQPAPTVVAPVTDATPPSPPLSSTAETVPVDRSPRAEPPPALTKPATDPANSDFRTTEVLPVPLQAGTSAPESPIRRSRRAGVIAGVLIVIGAVVVGALLLLNMLQPDPGGVAEPQASRTPAAAPGTPTPATPSRASPTPATPTPTPVPTPSTPAQPAVATVAAYYALLPDDTDGAWPLMSADYQENHAGGRDAYEAFWSEITDVEIADLNAPAPDQARATLTYTFRDGRVVREVTSYQLVDDGGDLKIAATDVISSTRLK
jgi:serine/threonine protein kinase